MAIEHRCSKCGTAFAVTRDRRSPLAWGFGFAGIYTTDYGRAIDHYNVVVCPGCSHAEPDDRLRVFGLFSPRQFRIVVIGALAVMATVGFYDLYRFLR